MLELTATQRGAVRTMPSETSTKYVLRSHTFGWYGLVLNVDHVQPTFVAESALACWKEAIELYSERLFLSESGPIRVEIDFSPILQVLEPEVERNCQFHSDDPAPEFWDELVESLERAAESGRVSRERGETGWEHFAQFSRGLEAKSVTVPVWVHTPPKSRHGIDPPGAEYACAALSHIFLAMNLASPGSCGFHGDLQLSGGDWRARIGLNGHGFEEGWAYALVNKTPTLDRVPLKKIDSWLRRLRLHEIRRARQPLERALFSLIKLGSIGLLEPESYSWIAQILEALYDPTHGATVPTLARRADQLLKIAPSKSKGFKRQLRTFYDERNAFAHGQLPIQNPFIVPTAGPDLESMADFEKRDRAHSFAMAVTLATLREFAFNDWLELEFREELVPTRLPDVQDDPPESR